MISGKTRLYGIFGCPVEHTFSPVMHNTAFEKLRLDACYVPFEVSPAGLGPAMRAVLPLGLCGLNITVPHKEKVISYLDALSEEARLIGAVNTVQIEKGKLIGHNTDGRGFIRSLKENAGFDPKRKVFLLMGSGGAARAIGFSLALSAARKIMFYDVQAAKAAKLARDIRRKTGADAQTLTPDSLALGAAAADCLINATPLGLKKKDPLPLSKEWISRRHFVFDCVYNPVETALLKAVKERGARGLPGIGMLLYQGVIAFEIWTGVQAPVQTMRNALARQIRSRG